MCMRGPRPDNSAQMQQQQEAREARQREEERAARIRAGSARIDDIFDGGRQQTGTTPVQRQVTGEQLIDPTTGTIRANGLPQGLSTRSRQRTVQVPADPNAGTWYDSGAENQGNLMRPAQPTERQETVNELLDASGNVLWSGQDWGGLRGQTFAYTGQDPVYSARSGGFDDTFFNQRRQAVVDFYQPQLDDKFKTARENLTFALARAGLVNSSVAGDKQGDLTREADVQRAGILSRAAGEENALRSRVNAERSALVAQLNATGDADRVSNEALARTQVIAQDQPRYDSLGDIFAGFATGVGQFFRGQEDARLMSSIGAGSPRRAPSRVVT